MSEKKRWTLTIEGERGKPCALVRPSSVASLMCPKPIAPGSFMNCPGLGNEGCPAVPAVEEVTQGVRSDKSVISWPPAPADGLREAAERLDVARLPYKDKGVIEIPYSAWQNFALAVWGHHPQAALATPPAEPVMEGCLCQGCGRRFKVDFLVPDGWWEKIKPEGKPERGGMLCGHCIIDRLESMGYGAFHLSTLPPAPGEKA